MEALIIIVIVFSIVSSLTKAQQRAASQRKGSPTEPRVREAAPEQKAQEAQPPRQHAPHVPLRTIPQMSEKQDVTRDQSGTITTTDRIDLVSRLKDTSAERAERKETEKGLRDDRPSDHFIVADEPEEMQEDFRREILHGIVMSEILARPTRRKPVWRRS